MNKIPLTLIYGIAFGAMLGVTHQIFFQPQFFLINSLPLQEMLRIFVFNSLLATLIVFGGPVFSLIELKFYSRKKAYKALDRTVGPIYFILKRISPGYERLGQFWRSLYLALAFPLICLFLITLTISFYLSSLIIQQGIQSLNLSLKLIPHISLEILTFSYAVKIFLDNSSGLRNSIAQKNMESFQKETQKILRSRKIWKRLLFLYILLFIAAVLEKFFIEI
jgi:hypothetical protein